MSYQYVVVGNDEAAFEMACVAATAGRQTAIVLPESRHSAWMMGQALRRLVGELLVDRVDQRRRLLADVGSPRLLQRLLANSLTAETEDHIRMLEKLSVDVFVGEARFQDRGRLIVSRGMDCRRNLIQGDVCVIGTGVRQTARHRPLGLVPFHRPESLFHGPELPATLTLFGGEAFGAGLAALFSLFGVQTCLMAPEQSECAMRDLARQAGVRLVSHPAEVTGKAGSLLAPDGSDVVDCRRPVGFTEHLNLSCLGVEPDENGQLWCASNLETWCSGLFGIGSVVGFSPDALLHPSVQAERILSHARAGVRRPHFFRPRVMAAARR